jgi:hypothetical protein
VSEHLSARLQYRIAAIVRPFAFFCITATLFHAQSREALCNKGSGRFETEFRTGVKLRVGASRSEGGLATRSCEATLRWDKRETLIATDSSQLDMDVFGADFGLGVPVAALQIKKADDGCCVAYQIYSLQKPPRLLRTITGGSFFSASDTDLDGRVEIWTDDAATIDSFEDLTPSELDFVPRIVLRFEGGRLMDVSAQFLPYFDQQIARLRTELAALELHDFKNSDGKLASTAYLSEGSRHSLKAVKIKVLEIVWSYLYSGREPEAWLALTEMWPASDVERIQTRLLSMRSHGIHAQVNGTALGTPPGRKKHATVFETTSKSGRSNPEVTPPQAILLRRPAPLEFQQGLTDSEMVLDLVIDSAGKVRSAEAAGNTKLSANLTQAARDWTFVPAFKDGRAVASHLRLAVSDKR